MKFNQGSNIIGVEQKLSKKQTEYLIKRITRVRGEMLHRNNHRIVDIYQKKQHEASTIVKKAKPKKEGPKNG